MITRLLAATLVVAVLSSAAASLGAAPTTAPAPATRSAATTPATTFPTPAELAERMKRMQREREKLLKVAYFDLSEPVIEKPADFSLFADLSAQTLQSLTQRLHQACDDKQIRAVFITLGDSGVSLSQAQEIRDALVELRKAGKQTFVYADGYDTNAYTLASSASHICLLEGGEIEMPGVGVEALFARGLLDKIGVKAEYIQIGQYKGAAEPFTRIDATPELRGEMNKLVDSLYEQIVDGISVNRDLTRDQVRALIDEAIIDAQAAKQRGLVDHLVDLDGMRDLITKTLGDKIELVRDYGQPQREAVDFSNPFALLAMLSRRPEPATKPAVALIYASGVIMDGKGGDSLLGDSGIGSDDLRRAFRIASRDASVKAIVLRINSPGGSALASEAIWQAARRAAKDKPLIVSIGGMAASGGYYLACAGDHIFADPTAIVGSIGVVGGKFVLKDLFDKIGLNSEIFSRGGNADLLSSTQPFTESQRKFLTAHMQRTYDLFVRRVQATRGQKMKEIDRVAQGRIFLASRAKALGMVDEIGGLQAALRHAAAKAGLEPGAFDVRTIPAPKTLADLLSGADASSEQAAFPFRPQLRLIEQIPLFQALAPSTRHLLTQQLQILQLLQRRPVLLASPYVLTIR